MKNTKKNSHPESRPRNTILLRRAPAPRGASRRFKPGRTVTGLSAALLLMANAMAFAANGTWVGNGASPIWGGVNNWVGGTIASGSGAVAYFTNTFNNGYAVTVNTARTVGTLVFTDPANLNDLTLARHSSDYILTLAVSSGSPVINVTQAGRTVTIDTMIAGTAGLAKNGPGTLILDRTNAFSGLTAVNAGTLKVWTPGTTNTGTAVKVAGGATNIVLVTANDGQWAVSGGWTNADNSTLVIDYGSTTPSTSVPPVQVASLSLGTNLSLRITANSFAGLLAGQSYPLIAWTSGGPADASAFSNLVLARRVAGSLTVTGNTLYLNITGNAWGPVSWNTGNGNWDTNSPNWLGGALYQDGQDDVLFDDAPGATGNPIVTLATPLSPASVTMKSTSHDYTIGGAGAIAGATSLTLDTANTRVLTLAAAGAYTGGTLINGGTLRLGANNVLPDGTGKGTVTVNAGGTLDLNSFSTAINSLSGSGVVDTRAGGTATLTIGGDNSGTTFNGVFQNTAGALNLVKNGTGLLTLSGTNTFTGTVTINAGTLSLNDPNTLATASGLILAGGTVLNPVVDAAVINGAITLGASGTTSQINGSRAGAGAGTVYTLTLNGPIGGAGNLVFNGGNQNGTAPTIILNAQSTYAGSTLITCDPNVSGGLNCYVKLGTNNALPTTTVLTLDGLSGAGSGRTVALNLNGFDQTLAGLTNVPRANFRLQQVLNDGATPATLTLNNASDGVFTGQLGIPGTDSFGLVKNGPARMTVGGINTYTGPTTVNNGVLEIGAGGQLGGGYYYGNITLAAGAALNFVSTNATTLYGTVSGTGGLTNAGSGTLTISGSVSLPNATVSAGSTLALSGGSINAVTLNPGGALSLPAGPGTATNLVFADAGTMNFALDSGGTLTVLANNGVSNHGAAGSITINITGSAPAEGTYTLLSYNGALQGSGFSAYRLGSVPPGRTYALVNTPGAVQLSVTPALIWSGAQSSEWSTRAIGGLRNWTYTANPSDYTNGVSVVFDDTLPSPFNSVVDISVGDVTPLNVAFENNSYSYTLQGTRAIAGSAALNKDGYGLLTILNNNTYTGPTTINGTLLVGNGGNSGALGTGALSNNGDLQFNRADTLAVANAISGSGTLEQNGTGTLILSGEGTYSGATTVNSGTLSLAGTLNGSSVTVANPAAFNETSTGVMAGAGVAFTHNSAATSTLAGSNTFTGAISVNAGELDLSNWSTNTLGAITVAGSPGATLGFSGGATYNLGGNSLFVGTAAGGSGTVNQSGGTVSFTSGNAVLLGNGANAAVSATYNLSGGTLTSYSSTTRGVILGVNATCSGTFNLSGTGNLSLTNSAFQVGRSDAAAASTVGRFNQTGGVAAVGTLTIGGNGATSATNTATVNLSGGSFSAASFTRLALGNGDVASITIAGSAQVTLPAFPTARGSGALAGITFDSTTGYLSPAATSTAFMPAGTFNNHAYLTTNGANFNVASGNDITVGQILEDASSQAGTLTKSGAGALTLTNANTYSGATRVNAGTLLVKNTTGSGTGMGTVTVNSGGTLGGTGAVGAAVIVNGTVSAGASVGTLNTGSQTWNGGGTNRFELSSATNSASWDLLNITGTLDVQATPGNMFTVKLVSMTNPATAGVLPDFDGNSSYTWVIATASGGILNFDSSKFMIDASAFANAHSGTFSVAVQGNNLVVKYAAAVLTPPALSGFGPLSGGAFPLTFSGPSGQTYSVLSSTNVALPLSSWNVLTTGTFGASPVTYTDAGATNARQFYRIKSPSP